MDSERWSDERKWIHQSPHCSPVQSHYPLLLKTDLYRCAGFQLSTNTEESNKADDKLFRLTPHGALPDWWVHAGFWCRCFGGHGTRDGTETGVRLKGIARRFRKHTHSLSYRETDENAVNTLHSVLWTAVVAGSQLACLKSTCTFTSWHTAF